MTQSPERLDALTGLRFVAAAAVFVYHLPNNVQVPAFNPGPLGKAAVGYFFVLSGFILAHVYRRPTPLAVGRFYLARFARVWPLHAVCLLLMLALAPANAPSGTADALRLGAHATLLQAWSPDSAFVLAHNGPAWSLSVEAFFYALFPLLVARGTSALWAIYALCWFGNVALYAYAGADGAAHSERWPAWAWWVSTAPLPRLQEFVLGVVTHDLWRRAGGLAHWSLARATVVEFTAVALAAASFFTFASGQWGAAWIGDALPPMVVRALSEGPGLSWAFALTIAACASGRGLLARALARPSFVWLGEISYAFYLAHTAVLLVVGAAMREFEFLWTLPAATAGALAIAASAVLHVLVERPARQALLLRAAGSRWRVALAELGRGFRGRAFLLALGLGAAGLWALLTARPTAADFAAGIAARSAPEFRAVRFGERELQGVVLFANGGGLRCWAAFRGPAPANVVLEARAADGRLVHTLAIDEQSVLAADREPTAVVTAQAGLVDLLGAAVLVLRVRDANGIPLPPSTGPRSADGNGLELLRLP